MSWPGSLLLVGCGNMGGAMLAGWLGAGLDPARFAIVDPMLEQAPDGVELLREVPDRQFDAVLLAVKPQMLPDIAPKVADVAGSGSIVMSILAGVELTSLATYFPGAGGLVRIMPNLAAAIGKSPVALAARELDDARIAAVTALMDPLGTPEWLDDEGLFDLVTALAGSGPAFVYRFIDALAAGAAGLGLNAEMAQRLALATVEGAASLASASPYAPAELADRVASPGGTTRAGLDVLDADRALARLVEATLRAARDRSVEMAREARK
jgi:pyrroline-5-carboxylate reductase